MLCGDSATTKVPSGTFKDYAFACAAPSSKPKTPATKNTTPAGSKDPTTPSKDGSATITIGEQAKAEAALLPVGLTLVDIPNSGLQKQLDSYQTTVQRFAGRTFTSFTAKKYAPEQKNGLNYYVQYEVDGKEMITVKIYVPLAYKAEKSKVRFLIQGGAVKLQGQQVAVGAVLLLGSVMMNSFV